MDASLNILSKWIDSPTNKAKLFPFSFVPSTSTSTTFDSSVTASQSRFASPPSDMQPTTGESVDTGNIRVEKASSTDSDAYTPSKSTLNGVGHGPAVNNPSLAEVTSQEYPPFDAETLIIHPIMAEESSDEKFYKALGEYLIESLLEFHAWAAARPRHEQSVMCELISSKMAKIEETEKDQGRYYTTLSTENHLALSSIPSSHYHEHRSSEIEDEHKYSPDACPHSPPRPVFVCSRSLEQNRKRLSDFVENMKNALAALSGTIFD